MIGTALSTLAAPMPLVAGIIDPANARDQSLAAVFRKLDIVDLRNAAHHLDLKSADRNGVEDRHRDQSGHAGPQSKPINEFRSDLLASFWRVGRAGFARL